MMFLISDWGNTSQNHNEMSLQIHQDGYHKNDGEQQALTKMWRNWNLQALLVQMSSGTVTLENILAIPQRTKHGVMYYPEIPLIGI